MGGLAGAALERGRRGVREMGLEGWQSWDDVP